MSDRGDRPLLRWLIVAFLVVQLAVPIAALMAPRPARFGWHMFTTFTPVQSVWTEAADGTLSPVDLEELLVHPRPETNLGPALADRLCRDHDVEAVVIRVAQSEPQRINCP